MKRTGLILGAMTLLVAVCACSHDKPPQTIGPVTPTPSSSPTASPSPTDPQAAVKATIIASYQHFWVVVDQAFRTNDSHDAAAVAAVATGSELIRINDQTVINQNHGWRLKGSTKTNAHVTSVGSEGRTATLLDCSDATSSYIVDAQTGKRVGKPVAAGSVIPSKVTMALVSGHWKVTGSKVVTSC